MFKRLTVAAALGLLLGACSGGPPPAPPAPPPFDPSGTYDISINAQGMSIPGIMVIEGSPETGFTGSIDTEMGGAVLSNLALVGRELTFSVPEVGATVQLLFEGDGFTGGMGGAMGEASISGIRRAGGLALR